MSESQGYYVYLNRLPDLHRQLPQEQRVRIEQETKDFLLRSFSSDLNDKVRRTLETPGFGPLPLFHEFVKMVPELFQLYINGLFHSVVAFVGVVAESLCNDLIEMAELTVEGRQLTSEEKQQFGSMRFIDLGDKDQ